MKHKPSREVPSAVAAKEPQERFFARQPWTYHTILRLLCLKIFYLSKLLVLLVTAAESSGAVSDFGVWGDTSELQPFSCDPPWHLPTSHHRSPPAICLLGQHGHLYTTPTRQFKSKLAVNGLDCTVWRPHFFSIKTFLQGVAFNMIRSSVTLQLINVYYHSLL